MTPDLWQLAVEASILAAGVVFAATVAVLGGYALAWVWGRR